MAVQRKFKFGQTTWNIKSLLSRELHCAAFSIHRLLHTFWRYVRFYADVSVHLLDFLIKTDSPLCPYDQFSHLT